jgi:hypothetical protein
MAISKITTWELKQIFIGKKFTYAFIIQFFVILAVIPLFDVYGEILENPTDIILPTSKDYLPIAVSDSPLYDTLREHPIFRLYTVSESYTRMWCAVSSTGIPSPLIPIIPKPGLQNTTSKKYCRQNPISPSLSTSTRKPWSPSRG